MVTAKFTTRTSDPYYDPEGTWVRVEPLSAVYLQEQSATNPATDNPWDPTTDIYMTWEDDSTPQVQLWIKTTAKNKECFVTHLGGTGVQDSPDTDPGWIIHPQMSWQTSEPDAMAGDNKIYGTWASKIFSKVGIGTAEPTEELDINADTIRLRTSKTPSSASDSGNAGQICWDSDYVYICIADNTWKRAALSTW